MDGGGGEGWEWEGLGVPNTQLKSPDVMLISMVVIQRDWEA